MVREKQPLESRALVHEKVARVKAFFDGEEINCDDGVKVSFESSWVHIKAIQYRAHCSNICRRPIHWRLIRRMRLDKVKSI